MKTRRTHLIRCLVLALAAAAIAAPIAQARVGGTPEAVSFLRQAGLSPSQIQSWTEGPCSYAVKPASCLMTPEQVRLASETTAAGFVRLFGASTATAPRTSIQALADHLLADGSRTPSRYPSAPNPFTLNLGL